MDASESSPNSSLNNHNHHHPHPRSSHAVSPYQANPDTNTTDTPDTTIIHLRNYFTYLYRHLPQSTHRSDRRVRSNDTTGLETQNSFEGEGALQSSTSIQQQQRQQPHPQPKPTETPLLHPPTLESPPPSTRFNFTAFWNPQRLFSAVRPSSTPLFPLPHPSSLSSTTSPDPLRPSSSGTATTSRMRASGEIEGDISTPTLSAISKPSSSSSLCPLVAQGSSSSQGGDGGRHRSSLSVKPVSASTTTAALLPLNSDPDPGPCISNSGRRRHQYNQSQPQQALVTTPGVFNALSIPKGGSISSDLSSNTCSSRTHKIGSVRNSGRDSSACYPSPTSPGPPLTSAAELEWVQKRIAQGQSQLIQYTDMIQRHETGRAGYTTLQVSLQKQREVLEKEIEILESAIRQGPSTPVTPLSSFFSSANTLFGQSGGGGNSTQGNPTKTLSTSFFYWSSPPSSYEDDEDNHQGQSVTCCPFKVASTRAGVTASSSAPASFAITPITTKSNDVPITDIPRRSSTGTIPISAITTTHTHNHSLPPISPCSRSRSPWPSAPFVSGGHIRSRSTTSLRLIFSSSGSSPSLSSSGPCVSDSDYQSLGNSRPTPSTLCFPLTPLTPSNMPSTFPEAAAVPLQMCLRCCQKASLIERQDQLRGVQRSIDEVQQKIHSTNSQIRHLQRTFVLPIETCLQEDREELSRLQQLQASQPQKERHQQQYHSGGGGGSRPSSGLSSSASGGVGGSGLMYRGT